MEEELRNKFGKGFWIFVFVFMTMDIFKIPQIIIDFVGNRFAIFVIGIFLSGIVGKIAEENDWEDYTFNWEVPHIEKEISLSIIGITVWIILLSIF